MSIAQKTRGSSILEILKTTGENKTIFNEYIEKKKVGEMIFKELHKRFRKNGFVLQDNSSEVGILSQCQCMQTLVSLAQDFGLDFNTSDYVPNQKGTIREIMDMVIEDVIERICVKDEKGNTTGYVFDASPYDTDHFSEEFSNIDTITWVVTSFFLILNYHAKVHEVCKWEPILVDIIKYGIDYMNDAFIDGSQNVSGGLGVGWNFTKACKEPSLYFSFAVCECYLDMQSTFRPFLSYLQDEKDSERYPVVIDRAQREAFEEKEQEYKKNIDRKVEKLKARHDEYNELARVFRLINDISDYDKLKIQGTRYEAFQKNCEKVAEKVWDFVHADLAEKFFYNDLKNTVNENELRMSTTSDVLFNTVYIVSILVGAGLDRKLKLEQLRYESQGKLDESRKKEREYENLLESCLLAVQKAFRTYESLKSNGKDYIVDQFLIGFNEDFDGHPIAINELRKLRMRCFSLLPMLIHANNVVSEYLVKYPQYNMKKYLEYILDSRLIGKDGTANWIWETDGFFSGSNYYFVLALNEFYIYHEQYEKTYIEIGRKNAQREEEIREKHLQQLQGPRQIIGQQNTKLAQQKDLIDQQQEKIAQLEAQLASVERPVEDAVRAVVAEEMEKNLAAAMTKIFQNAAQVMDDAVLHTNRTKAPAEKVIYDALKAVTSMGQLYEYMSVAGHFISKDGYEQLRSRQSADIDESTQLYLASLATAPDGKSKIQKMLEK